MSLSKIVPSGVPSVRYNILALFAASFATGYAVGFIHDRVFGDDDQDTPRPRRRRPSRE
jgi:hypothetical protein